MESHLTELHSTYCCFNIYSFRVPIKINKNTANAYTYYEKYNKQYYVYCTRTKYFIIMI